MWRDRTNLFISYRQSYSHHPAKKTRYGGIPSNGYPESDDESRGLMSAGPFGEEGDAVIEMDLLPPRWLDIQDEVTEYLAEIAKQTKNLEQLHQKHLLPGFDDDHVKKREEQEIERLTQEITRKFQSCQQAIKRIDSMVRESTQQGNLSQGEEIMARNLKVSLASRVGEVSATFRKKQSAYLKKLRALDGLSSPLGRSSTPIQNSYFDPSLQESETDRSFSQSTILQAKQKRIHGANEAMIEQREREIEDIAKGIIDLADIFQELQTMVIDQGSMLDRIDYNVERMATDVKAADKELTVATNYQRRSVKRKAMLLLAIIIFGAFILLFIRLGSKGKSSSPTPAPSPVPPTTPDGGFKPPDLHSAPPRKRRLTSGIYVSNRIDWHRRKKRLWDQQQDNPIVW